MEAYLFAFLLVLGLSQFFRGRYFSAGFVTGLLALTRGEGVLVLAVLLGAGALEQARKGKLVGAESARMVLKIVAGFAIPVSIWLLYAYLTFGSVLPNTLAAKQAQGQTGMWRSFRGRLIGEWLPLWGRSFAVPSLPPANLWWLIVIGGFAAALLRKRRWLVLAAWMGLYIAGYALLDVSAYWWYQLPVLFVLDLFFGLGLVTIVDALIRRVRPLSLSRVLSVLAVGLILFVLARPTVDAALTYQGDARGETYIALSRWFRENTEEGESIAFIEIGYLGYYTDNRIVDLSGLILPDVVPHTAERDFAWGFWQHQPDYYVYLPDFDWALGSIRNDPRFQQQYRPVETMPGPREADFVIYERLDQEEGQD